jgi:3-hydroxymyristoyl/3-hydroxydecanoyl-(acyl carrier protein) dehydratase
MVNEQDITTYIPQRSPFVMIEKLEYADGNVTRTSFTITEGNIFAQNGFFQEPGLVENIAQTAAAGIGYICRAENKPVPVGYIGAVQNLVITGLPAVGDVIETEVAIKNQVFDVTIINGTIRANGEVLAQCEMKIFIGQIKNP